MSSICGRIKMVDWNSTITRRGGGGSSSRPKRGEIMVGKNRLWGRSFLNRLNVTSCARAGTFNANNSNQREKKMLERKEDLDVDVVPVAEERKEEEESRPAKDGANVAQVDGGVLDVDEAFKDVEVVTDDNHNEIAIAVSNEGDDKKKLVAKKKIAATTIQASFRGHLARRAFRALKGLVKIQALARGMQVRRQAEVATTCMQALVRLQVRVRDRRRVN